jgi:hypothetical protein
MYLTRKSKTSCRVDVNFLKSIIATFLTTACQIMKITPMKKIMATIILLVNLSILLAQETFTKHELSYNPDIIKLIPDKVLEFLVPMVLIFIILNSMVSVLKNRAEHRLKLKIIEKGVTEESLIRIFKESNAIARLLPLKWFLFSLANGLAILIIYLFKSYLINQDGFLQIGIILLFNSLASFIYYKILSGEK